MSWKNHEFLLVVSDSYSIPPSPTLPATVEGESTLCYWEFPQIRYSLQNRSVLKTMEAYVKGYVGLRVSHGVPLKEQFFDGWFSLNVLILSANTQIFVMQSNS